MLCSLENQTTLILDKSDIKKDCKFCLKIKNNKQKLEYECKIKEEKRKMNRCYKCFLRFSKIRLK